MARKRRESKKEGEGGEKSKDLKIISVEVVTRDKVVKNPRQMALLYLIDRLGPIHERTLQMIAHELQQRGAQLGYEFKIVAGVPYSPEFKNDLIALAYVGFVEVNPRRNRRLQTTNDGKEALEKHGAPKGVVEVLEKHYEEIRNIASLEDWKVDEHLKTIKQLKGARRREPFGGLGF
ncbi:hypothetical protein apy_08110 [Aeropyrum pernix]|uniref:Uncharacterized protein n=1 Tax=Aeropyrum pernix TaxID=56636 RepID=A0A401H9F0_AERPX|nr:hypothetical protein [Aeropyrum pernix]GBF09086.1 hypothetical protein apy_08110 [Aeropyrum pernix]